MSVSAPLILLAAAGASSSYVPPPGLLLGLMLFIGIAFGFIARFIRLPRVIGYLTAGMVLKLCVAGYLMNIGGGATPATTEPATGELSAAIKTAATASKPLAPVYDVVLGLILFTLGGVFDLSHLSRVGRRVGRLSLAECGITLLCVTAGCLVVAAVTGPGKLTGQLGFAIFLGIAGIATAPAATLLVFREYEAKGPMTDTALTLTGLNNVVSTVLFHVAFLVMAASGMIESTFASDRLIWLDLAMVTLGSVVLGALLGLLISIAHAKLSIGETMLVFMGIVLALGAGRQWLAQGPLQLSLNFLLTALFMGGMFANVAINGEKLNEALRPISTPLFAAFFVLAGYDLHLEELGKLGWLGGAYVAFRIIGKLLGGAVGARWVGELDNVKQSIGAALLCQAGVAIGLAVFLVNHWPNPYAETFKTIIFGSVALFELSGPLGVKWVAVKAGEVKAITLLRRPKPYPTEGVSSTMTIVRSAMRLVGLGRDTKQTSAEEERPLQAGDIMRTNVKFIPADAPMEEVMAFVERSRFNHFPVVDEADHLVGMVRFSDIRDVIYDPVVHDLITAVDMADPNIPLVTVDQDLHNLFELFSSGHYETLPVVDGPGSRKVLGIVEQRDLLHVMHHTGKANRNNSA